MFGSLTAPIPPQRPLVPLVPEQNVVKDPKQLDGPGGTTVSLEKTRRAPHRVDPDTAAEERSRSGVGLPPGLTVDRLDVDGQEFAVFSWCVEDHSPSLTPAERETLALLLTGASNAAIAASRGVSTRTVANQVASLLRKHGAGSRYDLIRRFGASRVPPS